MTCLLIAIGIVITVIIGCLILAAFIVPDIIENLLSFYPLDENLDANNFNNIEKDNK